MKKQKRIKDQEALQKIRNKRCVLCGHPSDPAHIRSRGAGGDDIEENLLPLCRRHHQEQHFCGMVSFVRRYIQVELLLIEKGWELESINGHTKLIRK
jgi:hypothetical protein